MGSSSSSTAGAQIKKQTIAERQHVVHAQIKNGNKMNFYELFGFEKYSTPSPEAVAKAFRQVSLPHHPDKNPAELVDECNAIMAVLGLAKETLTDSEKKHRYDRDLRKASDEEDGWDTFEWIAKRFVNTACILGGSALLIASVVGALPTAGATSALGVVGSALLSAGINGSIATYNDSDQSLTEYAKELTVGAAQGAVCGGVGAAAAPLSSAVSTALGKVAVFAVSGAACGAAQMGVKDAADVMRGKKTTEEVFTLANVQRYGSNALIGAVIGGTLGAASHGSDSFATVTDDMASVGAQLKQYSGKVVQAVESLADKVGVTNVAAYKALAAAQQTTELALVALLAGYAGNRDDDRWLCLPTACDKRQPIYMDLARGRRLEIRPAALQALASKDRVARPLARDQCLKAYTEETALYKNVNAALRMDADMEDYAAFIWHAKQSIKEIASKKGMHTERVWRACTLSPEQLKFYTVGRKFLWASFVSTTKSLARALRFKAKTNALFQIECAGTGLTFCVDISDLSAFPQEEEVLFFPYSGFQVKHVLVKDGLHVIVMEAYDTLLVEEEYAQLQ